jgi:hypothetical protein
MNRNLFSNLPDDVKEHVLEKLTESMKEDKEKYRARRLCFEYRGRMPLNKHLLQAVKKYQEFSLDTSVSDRIMLHNEDFQQKLEGLYNSLDDRDEIRKALVRLVCAEFQSFFQPEEDDMLNRSAAACLDHENFRLERVAPGYEPAFYEACYGCYWGSLIRIKSLDELRVIELMTETRDDRGNIEGSIKYCGPEKFQVLSMASFGHL